MKKLFYVLIVTMFAAVISCSRESSVVPESDPFQESQLLSELSEYNETIVAMHPNTRGYPGWAKFCAVAGADITGAYGGAKAGGWIGGKVGAVVGHPIEGAIVGGIVGGFVCGVGGSALAEKKINDSLLSTDPQALFNSLVVSVPEYYPEIMEMISNETQNDGDNDNSNDNNPIWHEGLNITEGLNLALPQTAIAIGAAHNVVLRDLHQGVLSKTRATDFSHLPNESINPTVMPMVMQDEGFENYCVSYFNSFVESVPVTEDSLPDLVMQIYNELLLSSIVDDSEVADYINHYYSIVSESNELSDTEKQSIYVGLAVSLFSFNYWMEYGLL